jgi:hypothetical protein
MSLSDIGFAQTVTTAPRRAFDYYSEIGINTHLQRDTSVYYTQFDSIVYPKLKKLGIRNIRNELPYSEFVGESDTQLVKDRLIKLHDSLHIDFCFVLTSSKIVNSDSAAIRDGANYLSVLENSPQLQQATKYMEGYNEPDMNIYDRYPMGWDTITYAIQQGLYNRMRAGILSSIPVLAPSFIEYWSVPSRVNQMAAIVPHISSFFDFANIHTYDTGPDSSTMFPGWYYDITGWRFDTIRRAKPWVITETGYENAKYWNVPGSASYDAYDNHYLSELASAKYFSVLFMENFLRGAQSVYSYEFIDQNTTDSSNKEMNFGLLRSDGTEKPSFSVIKNTLQLFKDTDVAFSPTPLSFTLTGDTAGIRYSVYQKSNGDYLIALWQGPNRGICYGFLSFADFPADSQSVQLTFPFEYTMANIYEPLLSATPLYSTVNANLINLNVPDHLLVIELTTPLLVPGTRYFNDNRTSVYPNPCSDHFNIMNLPAGSEEYNVYSMDGRMLLSGLAMSDQTIVRCERLLPGTYVLILKSRNGEVQFRGHFDIIR